MLLIYEAILTVPQVLLTPLLRLSGTSLSLVFIKSRCPVVFILR